MDTKDTEYLKSLPKEEAARILHARNVAIQMKLYQKTGVISSMAQLAYGSDMVFDYFVLSLVDNYLHTYLSQPTDQRNVADALRDTMPAKGSDVQTAAVLMARLDVTRVAAAAERLNTSTDEVETALTLGIAHCLDSEQMMTLSVLMGVLMVGVAACNNLRRPRT
ncbi:MAG TPA: hypothetical protein VJ843_04025 [Candidatus Saccharimonadales bacterium]|nr:hypothetical protein [Candidatus Saccharimonadales bacterium]